MSKVVLMLCAVMIAGGSETWAQTPRAETADTLRADRSLVLDSASITQLANALSKSMTKESRQYTLSARTMEKSLDRIEQRQVTKDSFNMLLAILGAGALVVAAVIGWLFTSTSEIKVRLGQVQTSQEHMKESIDKLQASPQG